MSIIQTSNILPMLPGAMLILDQKDISLDVDREMAVEYATRIERMRNIIFI
jgi:hypothetical protein